MVWSKTNAEEPANCLIPANEKTAGNQGRLPSYFFKPQVVLTKWEKVPEQEYALNKKTVALLGATVPLNKRSCADVDQK